MPHYSQSKVSSGRYEPVHQNLFEVSFIPPAGLTSAWADSGTLLLEHVQNVGGLQGVNPAVDAVTQKFKWSDRSFAGMPSQTYVEIAIEFSMNLNDANQAYTYRILRDWYRLTYDPDTGYAGIKRDYTGTIIIVQYNRNGDIYRQLEFYHAFPQEPPQALDSLDYTSSDPQNATQTFRSDWYKEILA